MDDIKQGKHQLHTVGDGTLGDGKANEQLQSVFRFLDFCERAAGFDHSQCNSERSGQIDYTCRYLVLDPSVLKDECKTPQDQLFYATHGNGCRPDSLGTKVFGFHVTDGEKTYYRRTEFSGALKEELIPEWAKENTQKYLETDDLADEPDEDGGMTMNL